MKLCKYTYTAGKISFNVNGRPLTLDRDTKILTGEAEAVVIAAMKKIKQIRRVYANDLEIAEYYSKNPVRLDIKQFSDAEIVAEYNRRFDGKITVPVEEDFGPVVGGGFTDETDLDSGFTDENISDDISVIETETVSEIASIEADEVPVISEEKTETEKPSEVPVLPDEIVVPVKSSAKTKTTAKTQI